MIWLLPLAPVQSFSRFSLVGKTVLQVFKEGSSGHPSDNLQGPIYSSLTIVHVTGSGWQVV